MVNINQGKNENEELKLSPLGTEEINSVIKSFKNSTFNKEELYKKDDKNFVKKTLFDLAKETERNSLEEAEREINFDEEKNDPEKDIDVIDENIKNTDEKNDLKKDVDLSYGNIKNPDEKNDPDLINSLEDAKENFDGDKEKMANHLRENVSKNINLDEVSEEKIDSEHNKSDEILDEKFDKNIENSNETILEKEIMQSNKTEYEEKTLEALDSVREAVTKSLEENNETQKDDNKNKIEDSKNISNDLISEINLINKLFKNIREISNKEIEDVVKSKVIELAEDVIGHQIEKFPDKFLNKIKNSINEIKSIDNDIKIYLNPHDLELLNKFIKKNKVEMNFKLNLDSSLGRGDFTIDMGGVIQAIKYKKVIE